MRTAKNLAVAIPTGWDDAISYVTGNPDCRPFHTESPGTPYGVGGPPVYSGAVDPYGDATPYLAPTTSPALEPATLGEPSRSPDIGPDPVSGEAPDRERRGDAVDAGASRTENEHVTLPRRSVDDLSTDDLSTDDADGREALDVREHGTPADPEKEPVGQREATLLDDAAAASGDRDARGSGSSSVDVKPVDTAA